MGNYLGNITGFTVDHFRKQSYLNQFFRPDLFCLHNRWNGSEVAKLFNKSTVYFTILRNPIDVLVSLWDYNGLSRAYHRSLEQFAFMEPKPMPKVIGQMFMRNTMLYDFGLDPKLMDNMTAVWNTIKEIENTFHLVMIVEHFDESLVLLKQLLCWEPSNFTYLKLNSHKASTKSKLSPKGRAKLKNWLKADFLLYDHFLALFHKKVASFGKPEMSAELALLDKFNNASQSDCGFLQVPNELLKPRDRWYGSGVMAYKVKEHNKHKCSMMAMDEIKFIKLLRSKQMKKLRGN